MLILLCILTNTRKGAEQKQRASKLGVDEHRVIKTLVMEDETGKPLIILMHGDKEVSTKSLARAHRRKIGFAMQSGSGGKTHGL